VLGIVTVYFVILGRMSQTGCDVLSYQAYVHDSVAYLILLLSVYISGMTCFAGTVCFASSVLYGFLFGNTYSAYIGALTNKSIFVAIYLTVLMLLNAFVLLASYGDAVTYSAVVAKGVCEMTKQGRLLKYTLRFFFGLSVYLLITRLIYYCIF